MVYYIFKFFECEVLILIDMTSWMQTCLQALKEKFGSRVWFVGLQGSYGRGEATETSDIDVVVILDRLDPTDLPVYHAMLDALPNRELICGFLSGREELLNWEPADLFQFYYDTKPILGSLDDLLPLLTEEAVGRAIKMGACNIYHGCVHNMLYERSDEILKGLYKGASFVVQAVCFRENGKYVSRMADVMELVSEQDRAVAETFLALKQGADVEFASMSEQLFLWAKNHINKT